MIRRNRTSPASTCTQWATRSAIWTNTRHWSATRTIRGGFIWDFIDQAIYATQPDGSTRLCYGGDFGDRPSDYEFSGNGLVFADRTPAPKAQEVKQLYSNVHIDVTDRSVSIKNDNLFISTGDHHIPRADGQRPWRRPWIRASPVDDGRPLRPLRGQCHRTGR